MIVEQYRNLLYNGMPPRCTATTPLTTLKPGVRAMAKTNIPTHYWVYKLTCSKTAMSYVGMTKNKDRRVSEHRNDSSGKKLRAAIELYGFD